MKSSLLPDWFSPGTPDKLSFCLLAAIPPPFFGYFNVSPNLGEMPEPSVRPLAPD